MLTTHFATSDPDSTFVENDARPPQSRTDWRVAHEELVRLAEEAIANTRECLEAFAARYPGAMIAMETGRILALGTPDEVLADDAVIESYLGGDPTAVQRSSSNKPTGRTRKTTAEIGA